MIVSSSLRAAGTTSVVTEDVVGILSRLMLLPSSDDTRKLSDYAVTNVLYFKKDILSTASSLLRGAAGLAFSDVQPHVLYCDSLASGLVVSQPELINEEGIVGYHTVVTSTLAADIPVVDDGLIYGMGLLLGGNTDNHSANSQPANPSFYYGAGTYDDMRNYLFVVTLFSADSPISKEADKVLTQSWDVHYICEL